MVNRNDIWFWRLGNLGLRGLHLAMAFLLCPLMEEWQREIERNHEILLPSSNPFIITINP
jgi:hypothetical protein